MMVFGARSDNVRFKSDNKSVPFHGEGFRTAALASIVKVDEEIFSLDKRVVVGKGGG